MGVYVWDIFVQMGMWMDIASPQYFIQDPLQAARHCDHNRLKLDAAVADEVAMGFGEMIEFQRRRKCPQCDSIWTRRRFRPRAATVFHVETILVSWSEAVGSERETSLCRRCNLLPTRDVS